MVNETANQRPETRRVAHSSTQAGVVSGALLLPVIGGIFAGVTKLNSLFTPTRNMATLSLVEPRPAANYTDATQPQNVISISFDASGNPLATPADGSLHQLEPLRIPVIVVGY